MKAPPTSRTDDTLPSSSTDDTVRRFSEISSTFQQTAVENHRKNLSQWNDAYTSFSTAFQNAYQDSQKHLREVQHSYEMAAQDAAAKGPDAKELEEVYRRHIELFSRTYEEAQKRQQDAAQAYSSAVAQLREESQAQSLEAYRAYLQSLKDAWASCDIDQIIKSSTYAGKQ